MSRRMRLPVMVMFAMAILVLIIAGLTWNYRNAEVAEDRRNLSVTADYLAGDLNSEIRGTVQLLNGLSYARELENSDRAMCSAFLAGILKEYPQFGGIITIKPDGQLYCDSLNTGRSVDFTDRNSLMFR